VCSRRCFVEGWIGEVEVDRWGEVEVEGWGIVGGSDTGEGGIAAEIVSVVFVFAEAVDCTD